MTARLVADAAYGPGHDNTADIHLPPAGSPAAPLMLNLHGGGWYRGDKSLATACCDELADRGIVVVNANYHIATADPVPAMVADALAALRWVHGADAPSAVRASAAIGVVLAGDSAGAHIAALASAAQRDARLADLLGVDARGIPPLVGLVSWCGALSLDELLVDEADPLFDRFALYLQALTGGYRVAARLAELDPRRWLAVGMPTTLVVASAADFLGESSRAYAAEASRAGRPVTLVDYDLSHPECVHSWQLDPSLAVSREVYDLVSQFVSAIGA